MRVLITGVTGQDGRYLTQALRARAHQVFGLSRHAAHPPFLDAVHLRVGDVGDPTFVDGVVAEVRPEACYHLAAQHRSSSVNEGEDMDAVMRTNFHGAENLLSSLRRHAPRSRVLMASSCQVFGEPPTPLQSEATPRDPRNAYALAKVLAEQLAEHHRRHLGMFVSTAILFNHESPWRGGRFVSARVARAAAEAQAGKGGTLTLGSLQSQVDWMHARDAVEGMQRILSADEPGVFVVGTGMLHTVRELAEVAFNVVGRDWRKHVWEDSSLVRPSSGLPYAADATRLRAATGWSPSISFEDMVREMVEHHLREAR
ncbi:MAG: GDP-mannose 4,6-dehydratase [Myxococcota bacterium]